MVKFQSAPLDRVFYALSDPTRREILTRLARATLTVTELAEPYSISLPATSKHLGVLEEAGLVTRWREGRVRKCKLVPRALDEAAGWIDSQRAFWESRLDSLESYLAAQNKENTDGHPASQ